MGENLPNDRLKISPSWLATRLHDELEDKSNLLGQLAARWRMIVGVLLVSATIGMSVVFNLQKQYTAEAVLVIDPRRNPLVEGLTPITGMQWDTIAVNTEVSVLQLPGLVAQIVQQLNLTSRPEYRAGTPGLTRRLLALMRGPTSSLVPPDRQEQAFASDVVTRNLRILNEPRTYAIRIRYTSFDPVHAAEVANAIAETHIANERAARMQAIREAGDWLQREIKTLQDRVINAEAAELAYRKEHGLGDERATSTVQQEVNALALQVSVASSERAQAEARLQQATTGVMAALEEAVAVANDREVNTRQQLKQAQERLDQVLAAEAGLRTVTREVAASRVLLEDLLRRARSADSQLEAPRPETRIGSMAFVPVQPSSLGTLALGAAVLLGSTALALGLGFLMAKLQVGFRSVEEVERALGIEALGEVPRFRGGARRVRKALLDDPTSPLAESVRSICARLMDNHDRVPVILVTSAAPGDGKTVLASALAQTFALSNKRCLLIDADFRRPSAHRIFSKGTRVGLCEVLAGSVPLEKALTRVQPDPLTFLAAGEVVREPLELLSPTRLLPFLESVRQSFDVVILDSPPVLAVSDAGIISAQVSNVVLAIRWAVTTRSAVSRALTILRRQGGPTPAVVLSNVDHRKTSKYEDGRYGMDLSYGGRSWIRGSSPAERPAE